MKDIYDRPDFGRIVTQGFDDEGDLVEVTESYYGDKLHNLQVAKTRVIETDGFLDAAEKSLKEVHRLMRNKICHDAIVLRFEMSPKTMDVRKVHVTHTPHKGQLGDKKSLLP